MAEGEEKATREGVTSPPALSLENVLKATEGVEEWRKLCSSSCGIKAPHAKLDEIMQFSTATEQKEGAIRFWFENDPSPSWRRLIVGLDEIEANQAAEKIRKYAESLGEPTLTCENILEVLKSVDPKLWDDLAFALRVPASIRDQITKQFHTPEQKREALVMYWLQVVPNASWEMLAGALYFWENSKAVEATKKFLPEVKDLTLTIDKLCDVLEDVHNLNDLGLCLHIPNSKRQQLGRNHRSLAKYWMKYHPFPSWKLVGEALFQIGESDVLMEVRKKYLIATRQSNDAAADSPLGIDEVIDISDYLVNLRKDQIFSLGLALGLRTVPTLDKIKDSPTFLYDMLTAWLQGQDNVGRKGGHTWRALVKGLRHPSVSQNETADKIQREKCH